MGIRAPQPDKGRFAPTPTAAPPPDTLYPAVSLRYLKSSHCISNCTKDEQAAFANRIREMTQMTWAQIKQAPRHGLGHEKIAQLKHKLPSGAPDDAHALAFRFDGKKPMVGFRDGNIFYVVWFDRDFSLYNHGG